jgi:hypothetical protein
VRPVRWNSVGAVNLTLWYLERLKTTWMLHLLIYIIDYIEYTQFLVLSLFFYSQYGIRSTTLWPS